MEKVNVVEVCGEYIKFSNGLKLYSEHERDCCEHHWLGFEDLTLDEFKDLEFDLSNDNFFKRITDYGIELIPVTGNSVRIAGYGSNNGYYSCNLTLELSDGRRFDITECQTIRE